MRILLRHLRGKTCTNCGAYASNGYMCSRCQNIGVK